MTAKWGDVPALVEGLRAPDQLGRELVQRVQEAYAELYKQRGQVHTPEDTFAMVRLLGIERDRFTNYGAAFTKVVKLLKQLMEEELVEAVGEQDGIPNQALTVPDSEGDIRLSLDTPRVYSIDMDQLLAVHYGHMLNGLPEDFPDGSWSSREEFARHIAAVTMVTILSWGKFEPQVSKVRAYAATLARSGDDKSSSVVSGAITEEHPYKGVRFERKDPK